MLLGHKATIVMPLFVYMTTMFPGVLVAKVIYVDVDATGGDDGTSWVDAFNDLQEALNLANSTMKFGLPKERTDPVPRVALGP